MSAPGAEPGSRRGSGRTALLAVFAVFFGPVLLAMWLNTGGKGWLELEQTNRGELIDPARPVAIARLSPARGGPSLADREHWLLLVAVDAGCGTSCESALYATRQARLALGKDADRVRRVLALPEGAPSLGPDLVAAHPDLTVGVAPAGWIAGLPAARPAIVLVDPQGYAVLRYPAETDQASGLLKDLQRLLRISKIG